jgi:hypothetical protein
MAIPSVTGGEKEVGLFLSKLLHDRRYRVEKQFLIPNRFNVLAFAGNPAWFSARTWIRFLPFCRSRRRKFSLWPRACDTKGIIAAMLEAGDRLRSQAIDNFGFSLWWARKAAAMARRRPTSFNGSPILSL